MNPQAATDQGPQRRNAPAHCRGSFAAESYAYHEEFITRTPTGYMLPTRRMLENRTNLIASACIRARWKLELIRRTINEAFSEVDLIVLPTWRRIPRTVTAAIEREGSKKPLNPELDNTGQFNVYGIRAISVPCGFNSDLSYYPFGGEKQLPIAKPHHPSS